MFTIASNTLRDSIYDMVYRVTVGAILSITDGVTDLYVISTYYQSDELVSQGNVLLTMLSINMLIQLVLVMVAYARKSLGVKLREILITLSFLRPTVDAYRISTNHEDDEITMDPLNEMIGNRCCELAAESIPGCVLQLLYGSPTQSKPVRTHWYRSELVH